VNEAAMCDVSMRTDRFRCTRVRDLPRLLARDSRIGQRSRSEEVASDWNVTQVRSRACRGTELLIHL